MAIFSSECLVITVLAYLLLLPRAAVIAPQIINIICVSPAAEIVHISKLTCVLNLIACGFTLISINLMRSVLFVASAPRIIPLCIMRTVISYFKWRFKLPNEIIN